MFWQMLWTILLFSAIGLFAVLAVVVSIGGYLNIRWMFKQLKSEDRPSDTADL